MRKKESNDIRYRYRFTITDVIITYAKNVLIHLIKIEIKIILPKKQELEKKR